MQPLRENRSFEIIGHFLQQKVQSPLKKLIWVFQRSDSRNYP